MFKNHLLLPNPELVSSASLHNQLALGILSPFFEVGLQKGHYAFIALASILGIQTLVFLHDVKHFNH